MCCNRGSVYLMGGFTGIGTATNATLVYNLKTETWTSEYIAPPPIQSTSDSTFREKGLVNIILIITGALLTIILTAISVYIGISKRLEGDTDNASRKSSFEVLTDTSDKAPLGSGSDSSGVSSNHHNRHNWFTARLLRRLHKKSNGARPLSGDPHALSIDPTTRRSVQEGAVEVEFLVQHPHSLVVQDLTTDHGDEEERNPTKTMETKKSEEKAKKDR
jgi:hypothetical protein